MKNFALLALAATVFPSTEQTVSVKEDATYGGAHEYTLRESLGFDPETQQAIYTDSTQTIRFVHKPDEAPMEAGAQSEQLAIILLDRCVKLNARFPSSHNAKMIAGLETFLDACRERVQERIDRGVMGQLKK
ncbi:hypothetical protein ACVWYF_004151 [Hymenobacter sp. UYAg731]